ncbi:MAG TPA: serine/threonine-protein kinase [Vicinamibacterales bacterium]|nr:serine/threonine-protein kinase [Vicinamibacterales bacterium]
MDSARWERVQALFHDAVDLPAGKRVTFLRAACGDDDALMSEVLASIEEDDRGSSLLDRGVAQTASRILGNDPSALQEIGPYRIVRVIGEGGMGVVFLAERTDLGSQAAIKILRDAWLSPARRQRFATEQRTLASLNHPAIARLYDAGALSDGTPWIVMEYVDGTALTEYCRTRAAPVAERLRLFRDVCDAVQYAHRHLVIHRDLKPSNILVTHEGVVKLVDFGISKHLGELGAPLDQTRTGMRMMTPAYAAPEQIRGDHIGVHTDVYSLGVILYELLVQRLPFDVSTRSASEAEQMIVEQDPPRPSAAARTDRLSPLAPLSKTSRGDVDVLCLTAMHKDPARRYQTVEALTRDIDHYQNGEPLEARPDAFGYRAGKFVRRNWRGLSATTAVLVLVIGLVTFYTARLTNARNAALTEASRAQRIQGLMLNLFTGGEEAAGPSEDLRVVSLLDRGVLEAQNLNAEPAVQVAMYRTLGGIYQKLGNFSKAESLLQTTLDQRRSLFGPDSAEVAESLVALGLLRVGQARFDEAERLVRDGLAMSKRHLAGDDPSIARAATALGLVLEERGSYKEAIAVLEQAARLHSSRQPASADLAATLRELFNTHFYAGNLDTADEIGRRVLAMTRQVNGDRHALAAEDLINLGAVQHERGQYTEAERYYREALSITESWYGKDHYKTASNLTMLGRSLQLQKRLDEAADLLRRAVAIQERVFGPKHPRVASAVNDLGAVALARGDLDEAEAAFTRMAGIYRAVYGTKHYLIGIAISNLASVHVARQDYRRAEPLYREAIALYVETQSAQHMNTGIGRIKLGRALVGQKRYTEAETELLAGYEILTTQTSPSVSWLGYAREDLVKLYKASNQPEKARRFEAESRQ